MSEEEKPTEEAPAEAAPESIPESAPQTAADVKCPSAPTGEHDMFHNEGTDETYCRYCGKT